MSGIFTHIGDIAESIPVITSDTKCEAVYRLFRSNPNLEGVAIVGAGGRPSLLMRARFFQQIGTQYGYNLYMGRPVELVMNNGPLVVDYMEQITDVSIQAMNRSEEELYDLVLVTSKGALCGAISIRHLLLAVADVRAEMASFMNPLTGLPGNRIIDDRLCQSYLLERFSVLYLDLDYFKSYNDSYGFKMGDALIQATADLLRQYFTVPEAFLGHIGGDDFIVILNHHEFRKDCEEVIAGFEKLKREFYNSQDLENNHVVGAGRSGQYGQIPLVSLSISVVTNRSKSFAHIDEVIHEATRIKKICKSTPGSIICDNEETVRNLNP